MAKKHRVVIVGGGFGGLYAAQALKRAPVEVTLIDKRNFHLFQPLLYQVATGSLSPGEIAAPLRGVLSAQKNAQVLLGDAVDFDPKAREVILRDGAHVPYDYLIVATGSQNNYFGNNAWSQWAPALKTIEDATTIRHKILLAFEAAERVHDPDKRRAWLTFVIVGAGATGVELAGTLGEIANHTLKHEFRSIRPEDARILVIDRSPRVLSNFPEDLSLKAEKQLLKLGARVRTGITVTNVDENGVSITTAAGKEDHIAAHTVIWAAGVAISDFGKLVGEKTSAPTQRSGQINVQPDLSIPNYPEIFVVGDLAFVPGKDGRPIPGVAQVAMQTGAYAAKAIALHAEGKPGPEKPFHYFNKGDLAVIGRAAAVANIFGVHLSGLPAWLVWLFIHLMYLVEFQNRLLVFVEWAFLYLTWNRGARLITGQAARSIVSADETAMASVKEE
jgi:NADH:ubiquinone reductase (H+-translocating)